MTVDRGEVKWSEWFLRQAPSWMKDGSQHSEAGFKTPANFVSCRSRMVPSSLGVGLNWWLLLKLEWLVGLWRLWSPLKMWTTRSIPHLERSSTPRSTSGRHRPLPALSVLHLKMGWFCCPLDEGDAVTRIVTSPVNNAEMTSFGKLSARLLM